MDLDARLPPSLRAAQRLRVAEPLPGRHPVPRTSSQPRRQPPTGRDARLGADGQRSHPRAPSRRRHPRGRLGRPTLLNHPAGRKPARNALIQAPRRYGGAASPQSLHSEAPVDGLRSISATISTGPGEVAQLAEHAAENRGVGGSIPPLATGSCRPTGPFVARRARMRGVSFRTVSAAIAD